MELEVGVLYLMISSLSEVRNQDYLLRVREAEVKGLRRAKKVCISYCGKEER